MASPAIEEATVEPLDDNDTDYGSDFSPEEEQIVQRLLSRGVEEVNPIIPEIEQNGPQQDLRLPRVFGGESRSPLYQAVRAAERVAEHINNSIESGEHCCPDLSAQIKDPAPVSNADETAPAESDLPDNRSPLERFRMPPRKAFSVTDIVSPAWCELQYWYTLTKHGKKRRTPAMQQGTEVHERLERQVYTTVKVDVATKEDAWGLRIWNVIQGLRTLRETGLTREMELWGVIDGFVVNGVIDELSYICPDEAKSLEAAPPEIKLPADQTSLSNFFKVAGGTSIPEATRSKRRFSAQKVYIADVKTRGTRTLPSASAFRPTKIQLMLYHRLLTALATNTVDFSFLTTRYNLDPDKAFSDEFIAQVGSLNDELFSNDQEELSGSHESEPNCSQDSLATLLAHNNLSSLWSLMISEFHLTLPNGAASLGSVLKAEYRSRGDGAILGSKTFLMDEADLTSFVTHEMEWWKGERDPQGVVVEEAFKCRSCDFADECEWRLNKVEEAIEKARMTRKRTAAT